MRLLYLLSIATSFVPLLTCIISVWRDSSINPNLLSELSIVPNLCSNSSLTWPANEFQNVSKTIERNDSDSHAYLCRVNQIVHLTKNLHLRSGTPEPHLRVRAVEDLDSAIWLSSRVWLTGGKHVNRFTEFSLSWETINC